MTDKELQKTDKLLKPHKISPKQKRFCKEYVIDHNQVQAAIRAGYSDKSATNNAHRVMALEGVASHIQELESVIASELGITHHYVLSKTKRALEQAEKDKSPMGVFKGAELLGKHIGTFEQTEDTKAPQVWTGIEIDYGDGKLKLVTGTGPINPTAQEKK